MKEKDVEVAFCEYVNSQENSEVFGRQVRLSDGIADVVGVLHGTLFVAEIKLGVIDGYACAQGMGYKNQIEEYAFYNWEVMCCNEYCDSIHCSLILVGTEMDYVASRFVLFGTKEIIKFIEYCVHDGRIAFFDKQEELFDEKRYSVTNPRSIGILERCLLTYKESFHVLKEK